MLSIRYSQHVFLYLYLFTIIKRGRRATRRISRKSPDYRREPLRANWRLLIFDMRLYVKLCSLKAGVTGVILS